MATADSVQRVRIYLRRDDQWEGGPRYLALLEQLRRGGATGATALEGLAGFGPGRGGQATRPERGDQHQPVVIEWVDRAERIARLLPLLDDLLGDTLVTLESVTPYRATLRAGSPFAADRGVGDLMRSPAPAVTATTPLSEALGLIADEHLTVLPVCDHDRRLVGLIAEQDLVWRAGIRLRPRLLAQLTAEERAAALAPYGERVARDIMRPEPASVGAGAAIPQALVTMVEWGYGHLPVVDRAGHLVGIVGEEHVLRETVAQAAQGAERGPVRDAEPPPPVRLLMQTAAHQILADASLAAALAQLLASPEQSLLVVDAAGQLVGRLDSASVLRGLDGAERAAFLAALQRPDPAALAALPGADRDLGGLVERDPPSVGPQASLLDAARRLIELDADRLAVVAADATLLGIIGRGGLIRALLQQSE